jgi:hypothetical protein
VADAGGFVAGSKESGTAADASAVVDYRIPAAAWEPTLARLRALGTVRGQEITSDEVTGQVVDLGARIANLRATEAALQAIMARATRIDDVLSVQKQLTDTRGQIEELTAQKGGLEDRAAFGSLAVTFAPRGAGAGGDAAAGLGSGARRGRGLGRLVRIGETRRPPDLGRDRRAAAARRAGPAWPSPPRSAGSRGRSSPPPPDVDPGTASG